MTGYFANVVPRRYQLTQSERLADAVAKAHKNSFAALSYEYLSRDEIQSCAGISVNKALFDNLVLFENLPQSDIVMQDPNGAVSIGTFSGGLTSTYPLTLTIRPDAQWRFKFLYSEVIRDANLNKVLELFPSFLLSACTEPYGTLANHIERLRERMNTLLVAPVEPVPLGFDNEAKKQIARNRTELTVSAIWEKILGVAEIDVHTEFIALGGRSIAAVRMLAEIEDTLGKKLSMLEFVQQPTVAAIAQLIDGDMPAQHWRCLIPLKTTGSRPPVIFVHAVGTHALFMRSVTRYFHEDQPVLGLQLIGLDGECEPLRSIEAIATLYLQELKSYQPRGPYYFVAHCMGAVVAHEMITQLEMQGDEVDLFVVLDTMPPLTNIQASTSQKFLSLVRDASDSSNSANFVDVGKRLVKHSIYRSKEMKEKLSQQLIKRIGSTFARNQVYMEIVQKAVMISYFAYLGKSIDQKIVFISCHFEPDAVHMGWKQLTPEFEVVILPIGHETMFTEPEVSILGKYLNSLLAEEQAEVVDTLSRIEPSL